MQTVDTQHRPYDSLEEMNVQHNPNVEPRPRPPRLQQARPIHRGPLFSLPGGWRFLLPALFLVAIGAALVSNSDRGAENQIPVPTTAGSSASLQAENQAAAAPSLGKPAPTAAPTPTPFGLRPLAVPTMQPVANNLSAAPVRKPGVPDPDPSTDHVIVVDGDSGAVLFQRRAYDAIAPASLTKIMTAILGIERGNLADRVQVDVDAASMAESTVMGLEPWFDVTMEDILYGLMLPSGNDAAIAIGRYVTGSDDAFVQLMNDKASWLGLSNTHFANPHGLDTRDHYSCPADMVAMARYGMQYPEFRKLAAARSYDIRRSNISYTVYNLNPILGAYPGADGVKIGYTDNAGRSMVATAVRNGHRIYVAFMGSRAGLVPDTTLLLDWAFDSHTWP